MSKQVSNEVIVSALLQTGTIKEAAKIAAVSPRTIYERLHNDYELRVLYSEAKTEILRKAVINVGDKLGRSINTVYEIMENKENNPAVRLQAAQTIINSTYKLNERLRESEEITRKENEQLNNDKTELFKDFMM